MAKLPFRLDNDSRLGTVVGDLLTLMGLNILWAVGSLPVVTVGAATTALHSGIRKYVQREDGALKAFVASYKKNFGLSTLVWLPVLALAFCLALCFRIVSFFDGAARLVGIAFFTVPALLLAMIVVYAFPMIARYELRWSDVILNSVMLAAAYFPRTLWIIALNALPVVIFLLAPSALAALIFIWVPVGVSVTALAVSGTTDKIFARLEDEHK